MTYIEENNETLTFAENQSVQTLKGYKQAELGAIPKGWISCPLGNLARSISRGASPRPIKSPKWFDEQSNIGWVRISDVTKSKRYLFETVQKLSNDGIRNSRYVPSGSLIMSICATVGKPLETRINVCIHDGFVVFKDLEVDQSFLYYLLKDMEPRWSNIGQTGSQINLNTSIIQNLSVKIPSKIREQKAIAKALSDVDELIEGLDKLIAKKRDIKQATMQQLLTGKSRLLGFSGEWEQKTLGELGTIVNGGTPSTKVSSYWNGSIPWCTPTDITACKHKYLTKTERLISQEALNNCSAKLLPTGTLLLCSRATVGEVRIATFPTSTNQGFKSIVCHTDTHNEFLYYLLLEAKAILIAKATGSTFLEISKGDISNIHLKLPKYGEQTAIAQVLSDMDEEIEVLEARRDKTKALKQGMMQELLTGRIRLV